MMPASSDICWTAGSFGVTLEIHLRRRAMNAVLPRGLGLVQFAAATVDGLVLSSITVHALVRLRLSAGTVGTILAAAAGAAILAAPLSGAIADRVGLARAGAC